MCIVNNEAIRRHFHALTATLLQPLQPYLEPGPGGAPLLWDPHAFLQGLRANAAAAVPALVLARWVGGVCASAPNGRCAHTRAAAPRMAAMPRCVRGRWLHVALPGLEHPVPHVARAHDTRALNSGACLLPAHAAWAAAPPLPWTSTRA